MVLVGRQGEVAVVPLVSPFVVIHVQEHVTRIVPMRVQRLVVRLV